MRIVIGADHAGFELKAPIIEQLKALGHSQLDVGTHNHDPVDYPDLARNVADAILNGRADLGILLCGSGIGGSLAANKFPGIRAGLCHDTYSAHQCREHNDVNVLCLGARVIGKSLALDIVNTWLKASFDGLPSHCQRLDKVAEIERQYAPAPAASKASSK
jgi:ribose 5-phosphate isomerase B